VLSIQVPRRARKGHKATVAGGRKRMRRLIIGRGRFSIKAGRKTIVKVRISRRGRRRILRAGRTRCRISFVTRGADGRRVASKQAITLKAPKVGLR